MFLTLMISLTLCWLKSYVGFLARNSFSNANVFPSIGSISSQIDPYLIGRFLHLQRFHKQTPIAPSLIERRGEEFPNPRTTQSSSNLLAPLFKRLMSFHGLEEKPYVVGTSNDLVLCCQTPHYQEQRDFYICNPCTRQWIALPPTTRSRTNPPVGFICDRYYEEEDSTNGTNSTVNIKKDYRCKVVRILPHDLSKSFYDCASKFIVEVFSFETGEWRESIVSSPRSINIGDTSVAYNGMLYWTYTAYEPREETGLIRLDPFMIDNGSAGSGRPNGDETGDDDQYKFYIFDAVDKFLERPWICVSRGRLQMWAYYRWDYDLIVWELTGGDDLGSADKFYMKKVSFYPVTREVAIYGYVLLGLDPNDEDIFYVEAHPYYYPMDYFMYNIRTRRWSKVAIAPSILNSGGQTIVSLGYWSSHCGQQHFVDYHWLRITSITSYEHTLELNSTATMFSNSFSVGKLLQSWFIHRFGGTFMAMSTSSSTTAYAFIYY